MQFLKEKISSLVLLFIIILALSLRIYKLEAVSYVGDETRDIHSLLSYVNNSNPFSFQLDYKKHLKFDDPSQARLPYYLGCIDFFLGLSNGTNPSILYHSRLPFAILGALTVLIIYFLAKEMFDEKTGLLASFLVAVSPYYLGFSRCAVTTGDTCVSFFLFLALLFFLKWMKQKNQRYLLFASIAGGLACASKISAFLLFPFFILILFLESRSKQIDGRPSPPWRAILYANFFMLTALGVFAYFLRGDEIAPDLASLLFNLFRGLVFVYVVFLLWKAGQMPPNASFSSPVLLSVNMFLIMIIFLFIGSPIHLKPEIFTEFFRWFSEFGFNFQIGATVVPWHILTVLFFKLGPFLSIFLFMGIYRQLIFRDNKYSLSILGFSLFYLLTIMSFRWFLTWHLIPILALLMIIGCNEFLQVLKTVSKRFLKFILCVLFLLSLCFQIFSLYDHFPYYLMDGSQYGKRFIGYNQPAFIFDDGFYEVFQWMDENAPQEEKTGYHFYCDISGKISEQYRKEFNNHVNEIYSILRKEKIQNQYLYVDEKDNLAGFNVIIVSSIYQNPDLLKKMNHFKVVHAVKYADVEIWRIYRQE